MRWRPSSAPREPVDPAQIGDLLFRLEAEDDGVSLSRHLEVEAGIEEFREFVVHRSFYQLKESDPHSWAIPRLDGPAKTALLEVQADEYGGGRPERMHSRLFAKTMRALGLDDRENAYLAHAPGRDAGDREPDVGDSACAAAGAARSSATWRCSR